MEAVKQLETLTLAHKESHLKQAPAIRFREKNHKYWQEKLCTYKKNHLCTICDEIQTSPSHPRLLEGQSSFVENNIYFQSTTRPH